MTQREAREAVRGYLAHTGGSELEQVWNGLRREVTQAQIRSALKALGAITVKSVNRWPSLATNPTADGCLWPRKLFTVYRLGGAR